MVGTRPLLLQTPELAGERAKSVSCQAFEFMMDGCEHEKMLLNPSRESVIPMAANMEDNAGTDGFSEDLSFPGKSLDRTLSGKP